MKTRQAVSHVHQVIGGRFQKTKDVVEEHHAGCNQHTDPSLRCSCERESAWDKRGEQC